MTAMTNNPPGVVWLPPRPRPEVTIVITKHTHAVGLPEPTNLRHWGVTA